MSIVNTNGSDKHISLAATYLEVVDYQAGSGNLTYSFAGTGHLRGLLVCNDSLTTDITMTVNGMTITVAANEAQELRLQAFTAVSITAAVAWRLFLLQ
jgi:hypothetical protein